MQSLRTAGLGRPLPTYIPELDGLRGIAIGSVLIYHCHEKLHSTGLDAIAQWGWAGVNLFFVLSGFLITGIIADSRDDQRFFRNFYARRALRIWPVYALILLLNYVAVPWLFGSFWWAVHETRGAPWLYYLLFVQNLFFITLPGTLGPTWSLAIEEQFYLAWAPVARWVGNRRLIPLLISVLVASPFVRMANSGSLTHTHTLIHLDGLAVGALIALSLRTFEFTEGLWRAIARTALAIGFGGVVLMLFHGSAFTDSLLAIGFGGMLLTAVLRSGERTAYTRMLKVRPLHFLGTISYGLYMVHILCFVVIGAFDLKMQRYGVRGDLAVVGVRMALSIGVATLMWHGFEKPILRLKKYFITSSKTDDAPAPVVVAAAAE